MVAENSKRIAKNTLMLYIRMLVTMLVSLYTSRVVLTALGVEDFGIYNVVGGIVAMFGFLNATLATGTQRFLTFQLGLNNFLELKKTFSISLIIHIGLAVLIFILAETLGLWFLNNKLNIPAERMYAAQWVYQFSVFAGLVSIIQVPYDASIIAHERMNVFAWVSIIEVTLKLLIVYLLVISEYDKLIVYSILIFVVTSLIMFIYRIYCKKQYLECRFQFTWDKKIFQSMLSFSGWNTFGCLASTGANQGINILLNIFFGPVVNAARAVSYQVSNALNGFVNNFQTAVTPQITKSYAEGNIEGLHKLLFQNAKFAFLLLYFISLPVLFEMETILSWWLKVVPDNTVLFCRIILIHGLLYCFTRPFIMAIHATGEMKILNLTAGLALLMVLPVSYLLLKSGYPSYTPFIVYIGGTLVEFTFELFILKKYIHLSISDLMKKTIIPITSVVIISLLIPALAFIYIEKGLIQFFLVSVSSSFSILISSYYLAIDKETKQTINAYLIKRIHKLSK